MRDDGKRPPLRGQVLPARERQTNRKEHLRHHAGGVRGKACEDDKDNESRNRNRKEKGETVIAKGATTYFGITEMGRPSKFAVQ